MPIYEYVCSNGHEFELMRPISQREQPTTCPTCKANGQVLLSVFGATNGPYVIAAGSNAFRGAAPKKAQPGKRAKRA